MGGVGGGNGGAAPAISLGASVGATYENGTDGADDAAIDTTGLPEEVAQASLLPSIVDDPKLFVVQCKTGKEQDGPMIRREQGAEGSIIKMERLLS